MFILFAFFIISEDNRTASHTVMDQRKETISDHSHHEHGDIDYELSSLMTLVEQYHQHYSETEDRNLPSLD